MIKWECQFLDPREIPPAVTSDLKRPLTVGELVGLKCSGDGITLNKEDLKISVAGEATNYALRIVTTKNFGPNDGEFIVTSYKVGEYQGKTFVLNDGTNYVELSPLNFQVVSVIKNPGQEPYPAFGPWVIGWPWWYGAILLATLVIATVGTVRWLRRIRAEREFRRGIEEYRKRHSPFDEFQRETRSILKGLERDVALSNGATNMAPSLRSLDEHFRLFLTREFIIRFGELGDRKSLRLLRSRFSDDYSVLEKDLNSYFRETAKARAQNPPPTHAELLQIIKLAMRLSDRVFSLREAEVKQ